MSRRQAPNPPQQDRGDNSAGSPTSGEPALLVVGKLQRPHGLKGEIILNVLTHFPERLRRGKHVFAGEEHRPLTIHSARRYAGGLLLAFEGFNDGEQVGVLRNLLLYVSTTDLPQLPEGEYYHHQLLGLSVVDESGRPLGRLTQVLETGANDVYVVQPEEGAELLLPAIATVILGVDLERGEMRVRPPEWG